METDHQPKLTSAEISSLWTTFQTSTMIICGVKYFLATVDDEDIRKLLQYVLSFTQKKFKQLLTFWMRKITPFQWVLLIKMWI
jgi:hypothetical protein